MRSSYVFPDGSVPVAVAARVYRKDATWIRAGLISGWLGIGYATRNGELVTNVKDVNIRKGRINYYISPAQLFDETGYLWKGERKLKPNYLRKATIIFQSTDAWN